MSLRIINITIPVDDVVPDIISTFTPEENLLMLKIGSNCLKEGRQAVAGLTQKEIYNKIKDESKSEIEKLELVLLVEKELKSKLSEEITKIYQKQVEQLNKQIDKSINKCILSHIARVAAEFPTSVPILAHRPLEMFFLFPLF